MQFVLVVEATEEAAESNASEVSGNANRHDEAESSVLEAHKWKSGHRGMQVEQFVRFYE